MVQPLVKVKSVKKRTNPFKRHQCDRKIAVKVCFGQSCKLLEHKQRFTYYLKTLMFDLRCPDRLCSLLFLIICRKAGVGQRVLTPASVESLRDAVLSCPTSDMVLTRRLDTLSPTAFSRWWSITLLTSNC